VQLSAFKEVQAMMEEEKMKAEPFSVRCEDEKGEMVWHKLARVPVKPADKPDAAGIAPDSFKRVFNLIQNRSRDEIAPFKEKTFEEGKLKPTMFADINHQDKNGKTPLYAAVEFGNVEMTKLLFDLGRDGPDPMLVNATGWTALHIAVHQSKKEVVEALYEKMSAARWRAMLNIKDKSGRTAMHIAAYKSSEEVLQYMLQKGGDASTSDASGIKPSALAEKAGRRRSKEIIEEHNSNQEVKKKNRNSREIQLGLENPEKKEEGADGGGTRPAVRNRRASRERATELAVPDDLKADAQAATESQPAA